MPKKTNRNHDKNNTGRSGGVERPTEHDVLQGRGGQANNWIGNKTYREGVDARKAEYVQSQRQQKTAMSRELVRNWRASDPPGRFLELDADSGLWYEIGDKKARRKTSQLLREDAPNTRKSLGLPDPHDSGSDTTGNSHGHDEEWVPKKAAAARPNGISRRLKERRASAVAHGTYQEPDDETEQEKPPAKPSPTKKKAKNKKQRPKKPSVARGPSSMSKRDIYLAMRAEKPVAAATRPTSPPPLQGPTSVATAPPPLQGLIMASKPKSPSPWQNNPNLDQEAFLMSHYGWQDEALARPNEEAKQEVKEDIIELPPLEDTDVTGDEADQNPPPMAAKPEAFGSNDRTISSDSMGTYLRPLLEDEETIGTSSGFGLGDVGGGDLDNFAFNFGATGAPLEPLDFDTKPAPNECSEYAGWPDADIDEDHNHRRCGDLLMADCNIDISY